MCDWGLGVGGESLELGGCGHEASAEGIERRFDLRFPHPFWIAIDVSLVVVTKASLLVGTAVSIWGQEEVCEGCRAVVTLEASSSFDPQRLQCPPSTRRSKEEEAGAVAWLGGVRPPLEGGGKPPPQGGRYLGGAYRRQANPKRVERRFELCVPHPFLCVQHASYRGTSLIRTPPPLGPYSGTIPRVVWWSKGGGLFLMSKVPL